MCDSPHKNHIVGTIRQWELSLQVFKPKLFSCDKWLFLLCICDHHGLFDFPLVILFYLFIFCMLLWLFLNSCYLIDKCFFFFFLVLHLMGFPRGSEGKESACNAGDLGSILGLGISPGGGHGNPLKYSCLENPMDRGAWQATVHGVAKSRTWLSD